MKNPIGLSIPIPCHEKWDNFLPANRGGYCSSCKKEVIDFTHLTDDQIKDFFENRNGATCGRFRKDQLKIYSPNSIPEYRHKLLPLSLFGITLLLTSNQAEATEKKKPRVEITSLKRISENNKTVTTEGFERKVITGIVKDENDQAPIPGVNILLKGTDIGAVSDVNGRFSIEIQDPKESDVLVFSFIGYEPLEKSVAKINELSVVLKPDIVVLGEVCVKRWTPRAIWWRIKSIF
jgi:hypothetical protein